MIRTTGRTPALPLFARAPEGALRRAPWTAAFRAALGLVACLGAACADDGGTSIHASLHGVVRDGTTGKRLSGAEVEFVADTLEKTSDTTDDSGSYAMNVDTPSSTGRLTASKSGYASSVVSVFLDDADVSIDIVLTPQVQARAGAREQN